MRHLFGYLAAIDLANRWLRLVDVSLQSILGITWLSKQASKKHYVVVTNQPFPEDLFAYLKSMNATIQITRSLGSHVWERWKLDRAVCHYLQVAVGRGWVGCFDNHLRGALKTLAWDIHGLLLFSCHQFRCREIHACFCFLPDSNDPIQKLHSQEKH